MVSIVIDHNYDSIVLEDHLRQRRPFGQVQVLGGRCPDVLHDSGVLERFNIICCGILSSLTVVVAHDDGDDFVRVVVQPTFHGREVRLESPGIEDITRGVAEAYRG